MAKASQKISEIFLENHGDHAARILEELSPTEAAAYLETVPESLASKVLRWFVPGQAAMVISALPASFACKVLLLWDLDLAAHCCRQVGAETLRKILAGLPAEVAGRIHALLRYPAGTAGALMDSTILALPDDVSVKDAWNIFKTTPQHAIYYLYILNRENEIVGVVNMRELVLHSESTAPISSIMHETVTAIPVLADRGAILSHPGWENYHALPVVDEKNRFLGAIRYETLRHLAAEEGGKQPVASSQQVGSALAELYWLGVSGILEGMGSVLAHQGNLGKKPEK